MKKNQITIIVASLIIGLGVGYGSSEVFHKKEMDNMKNVAIKQNKTMLDQIKFLTFDNMVKYVGETTTEEQRNRGDQMFELSDGSWWIVNETEQKFIFQPIELGDWDYELKSMEDLKKVVETYVNMKNTGTW